VILSAGLTPAWQQILVLDGLCVGEVNRTERAVWCASGKVLNAGIAAHHLGGPSLTLAIVGGPAMPQITAEFQSLGTPFRWVPTEAPTRICTTLIDRATRTVTELVENGRPLTAAELAEFQRAFADEASRAEVVILIGSLPAGIPDSLYRDLLQHASCPVVLDFRGPGLMSVLDLQPDVIKPNREELAKTLNRPLEDDRALLEAMRSLNERGARWVVVTQGSQPVWVSSLDELYCLHPATIDKVVNPIASGDALAAGIAWGLRAGRSVPESVRLGLAAAAQNVRQLLPCRLDPTRLDAEAASIPIQRIQSIA
jgi:tagatose 6-phosphate kinase